MIMNMVGGYPTSKKRFFPPTSDWTSTKIYYHSDYTLGEYSFENNQFYGSITGKQAAGMITTGLKSLSDVTTITIKFEVTGSEYLDTSSGGMVFYLRTLQTGDNILDKVVSQEELASGIVTIDVSSYNGSYYLLTGIALWSGEGAATLIVKEVSYT